MPEDGEGRGPLKGYWVSFWRDKSILELDGDDSYKRNIVNVLNGIEFVHLKLIKMVNFMVCVFYHDKSVGNCKTN